MRGRTILVSIPVVLVLTVLGGTTAGARDTKLMLSVAEGLGAPAAKEKLGTTVKFF